MDRMDLELVSNWSNAILARRQIYNINHSILDSITRKQVLRLMTELTDLCMALYPLKDEPYSDEVENEE